MEDNVLDVEREKQKHLPGGMYGNESVMYGELGLPQCAKLLTELGNANY